MGFSLFIAEDEEADGAGSEQGGLGRCRIILADFGDPSSVLFGKELTRASIIETGNI